jgi:hypothetical protein
MSTGIGYVFPLKCRRNQRGLQCSVVVGVVSSVDHGGGLTSRGALALLDRDAVHADAREGTSTISGKSLGLRRTEARNI